MGKRIYVGNLSYETNEVALRTALGQEGRRVERVNIVLDRETGRPRGFAFVEMGSEEDAAQVIATWNDKDLQGRRLRVNEAEDRRPGGRDSSGPPRGRTGAGGGQGGGGGSGGGGSGGGGSGGGGSGGGGSGGGSSHGSGGSGASAGARAGRRGAGDDRKRGNEKKITRRRHDEERDYGGRRGSHRFEGEEDDW